MLKMDDDGMVKHWIRFRHGHATEYGNLQRMTRQTAASREPALSVKTAAKTSAASEERH